MELAVVADASILIDLLQIDFIDQFFRLHFIFHCTDLILNEITRPVTAQIDQKIHDGELSIHVLDPGELQEVIIIQRKNRVLSIADCTCLWLCDKVRGILLTSDGRLRSIAKQQNLETHGILWIFDQLILNRIITPTKACERLIDLRGINPRLPGTECQKRLKRWSRKKIGEKKMARNKPYGDNHRVGAVRERSQTFNPKTEKWVKRDTTTGQFLNQKADRKPFKGVKKEK